MAKEYQVIGKYKILAIVARGGMGIVYRAYHPTLRRQVIIKKLTIRGNKAVLDRFKREAQLLLELQNQYIVHMFDYFTEGSSHYIVLEYVDGMSLDKLLQKRKTLSVEVALLIVRDACRALHYAHGREIVHRDIKPGNILMSKAGDIKLADFGISARKSTTAADDTTVEKSHSDLTQAGVTLGTPAYMPPEQLNDSKNVDARADIYAMGIMLYEMVTGLKPYPGNMAPETILQIQKGKYTAPEKINELIPASVCRLIKKMMRPKPNRRYQNVSQIQKKIERYLGQYDTSVIKETLRNMITKNEKYQEPEYSIRHKLLKKLTPWLCIIGVLLLGGVYSWNKGFIHRYVLRSWFTPVTISMRMPQSATADSDLPMRAFFFSSDDDAIPEIENTRRVFQKSEKNILSEKKQSNVYSIKPVYLRPGNYRIKVATGSYLWWESMKVGTEAVSEELNFLAFESRDLKIHAKARSSLTNKTLDTIVAFDVFLSDWIPLSEIDKYTLKTGKIYRIRARADGYKTEVFSLRIEWYQDTLYISTLLTPNEN
ncbi:MAG TPA: serine/threonine-protein kinase [Treponemataceae bacterium]|nr:serine/threonine-protein kinase [Treponemataceae bacterium]